MITSEDRWSRWRDAHSLAVYYGHGREEQLASYDLAVVEASGQTAAAVARMQRTGTLLLAYLSLLELPVWDQLTGLLRPDDYLQSGGLPLANAQYGGRLLDLRRDRCRRLLIHRASRLLAQGYDGLFLDTVDQAESSKRPLLMRAELVDSTAGLINRLHALYPGHLLVQNNGLGMLLERTAPALAGVCWESPAAALLSRGRLSSLLARIRSLAGQADCRLLLLLPGKEGPTPSPSVPAEVLVYRAPRDYLELS